MSKRLRRSGSVWLATSLAASFLGWKCEGDEPPHRTDGGNDSSVEADGAEDVAVVDSATEGGSDGTSPEDAGADGGNDAEQESAANDAAVDVPEDREADGVAVTDSNSGSDAAAADDAASGVVLSTISGPTQFSVACNVAPPAESFVVTNPTSQPLTWTASVTATGAPVPSLMPAGSTLEPGASATVNVIFRPTAGPSKSNVQVTVSDGISQQVVNYSATVNGYLGYVSGSLDFGVIPSGTNGPVLASLVEVVSLFSSSRMAPSPCALFRVTGGSTGSSVTFRPTTCGTGIPTQGDRAANESIQVMIPALTPAGRYFGQFELGADFNGNPLCNGPVIFSATVTVVAPGDGGPDAG